MATEQHSKDLLPSVIFHRPPSFDFPFRHRLEAHFRLLDMSDSPNDPTHSFLLNNAQSSRALLCVDPTPVSKDLLSCLPSLQIIVGSTAGVDHIDLTECRRRGIQVTSAGSAFCEDVADYAVALLIDVLRRLSAADRFVQAGMWPLHGDYPVGSKLGGKRIGIVGLGNVGSEVAKRLASFGCSIAYTSRTKKPSVAFPYYSDVLNLAINSDALILCCALTKQTHHIINKEVMAALGKEGVIINVGRGALIDEQQLVQFLVRGELGGAGFDVFENEPDVPKELFLMDKVVLSPHVAVATSECFDALEELIIHNLKAFFSNQPLRLRVVGTLFTTVDSSSDKVSNEIRVDKFAISETLRWFASRPNSHVPTYQGYHINDIDFNIKAQDVTRSVQNSGVFLVADDMQFASAKDKRPTTMDMNFYGRTNEVWEVDYYHFRIPVFLCDWVESARGVKVDDLDFTLVKLDRIGHLNDLFVLATHVKQIFYIEDPLDPEWSVVVRCPDKYFKSDDEDEADVVDDDYYDDDNNMIFDEHPLNVPTYNDVDADCTVSYARPGEEAIWIDK
ncbi:glyoxylate/hydroxypyruvate reductase HPR3-like isoform X2 [Euphorbia lathyris]|uniref:glyoxylate/hydroxypyruvate reductase HPR3-like isoform X2 n=1 Tax=Euphorbia lathyris TaxID=212925 RepID=UPI003313F856